MNRSFQHVAEFAFPATPPPASSETAVDRIKRISPLVHRFCVDVIDAYREQELHHGHRANYGLTAEDLAYAQALCAWSDHEADLAIWVANDDNRAAHDRATVAGLNGLDDVQRGRLAARPKQPSLPRPQTLRKPPDWPPDPAALDAISSFFTARAGACA